MPTPTARQTRLLRSALLCLIALLSGCAGFRPLDPGADLSELGRDEGVVVIPVLSEIPVSSIEASYRPVATDLEAGEHLLLLVTRAGEFRWNRVQRRVHGIRYRYLFPRRQDHLAFSVKAGQINYPGLLILDAEGLQLRLRTVNRSGKLLRQLRESHPELLAEFPLRYTGDRADPFLEHYDSERRRVEVSETREAR